jgi:glycosyltransferase involved in cell wall biosynthesis
MSVYNGAEFLFEAVESILQQTHTGFHFLIIDDASMDATPEILRELAGNDSRIQVITNEHNMGLSASLNLGLGICDTTYVARMDADDIAYPSRLATQLDYMQKHPEVTVCGTWADLFCEGSDGTRLLKMPTGNDDIRATMFLRNPLNHPTVVFRKDAVLRAGGYDPAIRYAQDYDLWARLAEDPEVRFANLNYSGLRYRTYPEETRNSYRDGQRCVTMAVSERLLRRAGFPLQDYEVPLLQSLVTLSKPDSTDSMLQLAALTLRLLDWGRANLAETSYTFVQSVEECIEEIFTRYNGVPELYAVLQEQQEAMGKYEEGIEFLKQQLANYQEVIAQYQRKEVEDAGGVRHIGRMLLGMEPGRSSLWRKVNVKTCVLLKKLAAKIHPAGYHYAEKLEYCVRHRDMGPIRRFATARVRGLQSKIMCLKRRVNLLRPFSAVPLQAGQPLVSVVIPCFNYGLYVEEAIDSVLAQTLKNLEIIVVEGGSTDGFTRPLLESLDKPKTTVLFQSVPTLVGENRNFGIRHAQGRYICCLDADDVIQPTYLEKAVYLLETYGYDIVSTAYTTFGETQTTFAVRDIPTLEDMLEGNHIMTCAVFRRDRWANTQSGFVDSGRGADHVAEDWRLWIELAAQGARMRNIVHESLLLYRTHGSSLSTEHQVRDLSSQREQIRTALAPILTPEAIKRSLLASMEFRYCATLGGVMGATQCRPAPVNDGAEGKPTFLLCMGLIINGGAERLLSTVVGHLAGLGWRVVVVSTVDDLTENSKPVSWFTAHTSEVYQLQRFLFDEQERADFIRYLVASRHVDIVLQAGSVLLYRMLKGLRATCPHLAVVDLLFNTAPEGHIVSNRKRRAEIDHIITENSEVENWLLEHGEDRAAISRIYSGISVPQVDSVDAGALRASLGIAVDSLVFGFSGRLSPEKNPLAIVELAYRCRDMENVYFVMTGGGPLASVVERRKEELRLGRMIFMGFVDDPATYLAMYDALLLPSVQDGRPVAVMEAMLLGTPCLASRIGGLPEMVEDGVTGFLTPPGDLSVLEQVLRQAASAPALLKKLGEAAEVFAREHFDPTVMCRNYEDVLSRTIAVRRNEA